MGAHPPSSRAHPLCAQKEQLDAAAADVCTALHRGGISGNGQSKVCAVHVQTHTSKEPGAGAKDAWLRWGGAVAVAHDAMRRSREGTQPSIRASRGRNTALLPLWQGVVL